MHLRSVSRHPSFQRARAWTVTREGPAPSRWLPQGLARLDDTWFAAHPTRGPRHPPAPAFDALPDPLAPRARAACGVAFNQHSRLPTTLCVACARWCWSDLVELPPPAHDKPALLQELGDAWSGGGSVALLPQLSPATLIGAMTLSGLPDLGGLLARAPDRTAAAICSRLPTAWRERVWQHRTDGSRPGRKALKQLKAVTATTDPTEALFFLGALHFARLLADHPLPRQQTAQLLPVPAARHLLGSPADSTDSERADLLGALQEAAVGVDALRP